MRLEDCVTAGFVKANFNGLILCTVSFYNADYELVQATIADFSHQALIETLENCWPTWTDCDQNMARSEKSGIRELAYS
jgi:hypothetical protein